MTQEKNKFPFQTLVTVVIVSALLLGFIYVLQLKPHADGGTIPGPQSSSADKNGVSPYQKREVNNTIRKHMNQVQACYNAHLAEKPKVEEGKVQFDWQIEPDGDVDKVGLIFSEFQMTGIELCLEKKIKTWEFPPPPDQNRNTYAEFTFNFRKQGNLPKAEDLAPQIINTPKEK